ncbi:MAG: transcription factor E [Hadesarchaea archaeon]|nr:transcription factor E [Hadesarchaea archaeon]
MEAKSLAQSPEFKKVLSRIAGEHGAEVAEVLASDGEATDEEIANETDIRLNLVRKILYDLYDHRIVSYKRSRDDETGWYVYHWRIEPEQALELLSENERTLLRKLQERLEHEKNTMFFTCSDDDCPRVEFDEAISNDFKCPQCGKKLKSFDNSGIINALERRIDSLKSDFPGS